jgi:hypothetical protein
MGLINFEVPRDIPLAHNRQRQDADFDRQPMIAEFASMPA